MLASRSIVTLDRIQSYARTQRERVLRLREEGQEAQESCEPELDAVLEEMDQRNVETQGLKAVLRDLTVTFAGERSCFSDAQLSRIKELTAGISVRGPLS